jgi:hypothetical protein
MPQQYKAVQSGSRRSLDEVPQQQQQQQQHPSRTKQQFNAAVQLT